MERKLYTVAEANALLPYLAPALIELRDKYADAIRIRAAIETHSSGNGSSLGDPADRSTLARVDELLARLDEWGVQLKDLESGLVDFPAVIDGEEALLCWRLGEDQVAYWHTYEDGFAGRRPLGDV